MKYVNKDSILSPSYLKLFDEIDEKTKNLKTLKTQLTQQQKLLDEDTTWIRGIILCDTLNMIITKEESKWIKTHNKKLDNLINEKKSINVINSVITSLSSRSLNNNEQRILTYVLKHGIAISPKQNDILVSSEASWAQVESKNIVKENFSLIQRAKILSVQ